MSKLCPEIETCPACGALPCDWVFSPKEGEYQLLAIIYEIRQALGVGDKVMLWDLPAEITRLRNIGKPDNDPK